MTEHLVEARRADVAARTRRVEAVLGEVAKHGEFPLTVVEIARRAQVHKSFIHRHPELKAAVDAARAVRTQTLIGRLHAADVVTSASLKADLENERPPAGGCGATSRRAADASESFSAPLSPLRSWGRPEPTGRPVPASSWMRTGVCMRPTGALSRRSTRSAVATGN